MSKNLIIGVLIVVAIILGFLIFQKNNVSDNQVGNNNDFSNEDVSNQNNNPNFVDERDLSSLSKDEKEVLNVPYSGTEEEKQKHFDLAVSLAKDTGFVDVAGCMSNPVVVRVVDIDNFFVTNTDSVTRTIIFDQDNFFEISSGEKVSISSMFSRGRGLYGYGCDENSGVAGLLLITEE